MLEDLISKNRSYRRFKEETKISKSTLKELVNLARLSASAANKQPLKYVLSSDEERNDKIFPTLSWAGYLKNWDGPKKGERPPAYLVMLGDRKISEDYWADPGIAAQSILLGATERGLGGCILGSIDREKLRSILKLPERYEILYVIAIGKPKEKILIEEIGTNGNIKYWRDDDGVHHVPKRSLDEIILELD